jgi:hypothetical protein
MEESKRDKHLDQSSPSDRNEIDKWERDSGEWVEKKQQPSMTEIGRRIGKAVLEKLKA